MIGFEEIAMRYPKGNTWKTKGDMCETDGTKSVSLQELRTPFSYRTLFGEQMMVEQHDFKWEKNGRRVGDKWEASEIQLENKREKDQ